MSVDSTTLERSALERKDREELTTIAQALGVKPPSRARKAEIVQLILELTGVAGAEQGAGDGASSKASQAGGAGEESAVDPTNGNDRPDGAAAAPSESGGSAEPGDAGPADATGATAPGPASGEPATGEAPASAEAPVSEPPAEWELAVSDQPAAPQAEAPASTDGAPQGQQPTGANGDAAKVANGQGGQRGQAPGPRQDQPARQDDQDRQDRGSAPSPGGQARDEQRKPDQGNQNTGGDQGGKPGADANEPGNRRRRRRGRRGGGEQERQPAEDYTGEPVEVEGLLDLRDEGYGFLRVRGSLPSKEDIYVSVKQARQFGLRKGDHIKGASRPALRNEKNPALLRIDQVNGRDPEQARRRHKFEDLTPLFPDEKLRLETTDDASNMTARIVDIIAPIGKGQRGLIVSPPKAGKTTIMKQIARSIEANNPEVKLIVLLVDERPEEVTDMRRWLRNPASEVVASTFDRPSDEHAQVSELTIERAKRLVEEGKDVCIILDGITRLARAYNLAAPATGRIMSGGVDSGALYPPKRFFGAARNVEEGGSLTILATALIETGSKMDEVIFEEFKGTGNMELRLDRRMAERRIYPAIDVDASSTRHEELLFPRQQLNLVWALRRVLSGLSSSDGGNTASLELLIDRMKTFRTNEEFLAQVAKNRLAAG
jgi:transcription termination factor Rho